MKNRKVIIFIVIVFAIIIATSIIVLSRQKTKNVIAQDNKAQTNIKEGLNTEENINDDVVLTLGTNYEIYKMSEEEIMKDENYYVVIGKVTSIDGATNYNESTKEYTTIFSLGKMEVLKDIKGNMETNSIEIMKRGGQISLEQYEKGLNESQKQKEAYQNLSKKYSKQKATVKVELKSLDEVDIELNKEYLFVLSYNKDFDRYLINAFPYAIKEVKMENSNIYYKDRTTQTFEEFSNLQETLNK